MLLAAVLLAGTVCALVGPFIVRRFIDDVTGGRGDPGTIGSLVIAFAVVGVARHALTAAETGVASSVAWRGTNRLRADVVDHALKLPMRFHHQTTPGAMVERVEGDISLLGNLFSRFVVTIVAEALIVIGVVVAMWWLDWRIGVIFLISMVVGGVVIPRVATVGEEAYRRSRAAVSTYMGGLEERLTAVEDLQALGASGYALGGLRRLHRFVLREELRAALIGSSLVWALASVFTAVITLLALTVGGLRFGAGAMTLGTVYLIFAFTQQLQEPLIRLSNQLQDLQRAMAGLSRTRDLLNEEPEPDDGTAVLPSADLGISAHSVSFAYHPGTTVLRELSFEIPAGGSVGIVGRTGGGKSTLAKLVAGLERPDTGQLKLGDTDITTVARRSLRARVALVTQDVFLLDASIRDNIALFDPSFSEVAIWEALDRLGLRDWVARFPAGIDSVVSQRTVSAGQAQLLALARVSLSDPAVLVLDEASARLDPDTESHLNAALRPVITGRTSVVIAHRLTTLDQVDLIMVIDDGQVVEFGPRESLRTAVGGRYAALLEHAR
ncbi:ABC transporter ATP-binding protein [Microlunatus speluncae]|uniref:ABC transporter ATP-binding protein n=1 Tax=Microlunatus speluncae TaxID=2594267 RepID=UPI001375CCED|nr:ABC transporter ATP-binding protein [Microlunatus speluncae]